ncbi:Monothiol glutaredoxin-7 [Cytospora mali]|uniref:Monothiol glutaredoxin-7 n=1 Tax=Cytospora mali TaxID=578113 RepID=A0A194VGM2_CYTMA|nr:Monothiol glutaredoxin-7 [Valsa mali var. pyri (nom. inval.)]
MPSPRRLRLLLIGVVAVVITTLVYTSQLRQAQDVDTRTFGDFYGRTKSELERVHSDHQTPPDSKDGKDKDGDGDLDADDAQLAKEMADRLKAAEQKAKDSANAKAPKPDAPEKVIVIIFSKTYCQFSKRAKGLLLEKYSINPEPYVVELDTHPLGKQIQDKLAKMTGRKTVPNIMINGKSIGGSDDIAQMDNNRELVEKIRTLGSVGGKTVDVKERFEEGK